MESSVKLFGHPAHQMLVVFPAGLLVTSLVFDLLYRISDVTELAVVAYYLIAAGIVGGLLAAPFGLIDWLKIPRDTRARSVGAMHGIGNVAVLLLFVVSFVMRMDAPEAPGVLAHIFSAAGTLLLLVTAWLGGELIDRLGVGICDDTGLNAPSTLRRTHHETKVAGR